MKFSNLLPFAAAVSACADHDHSKRAEETDSIVLTGHVTPDQISEFLYVPFEVKPGVTSIHFSYDYPDKDTNVLDIGVFDERGYQIEDAVNGTAGFRGWSFTVLDEFTISPSESTPSYISGPIAPGTWHVVVGPRGSVDEGFDYEISIEFSYDPVERYYSTQFAATDLGINEARRARMDNDTDGHIWLRGDFHVHSIYSDGNYTPEEQVSNAIKQNLDFFYFTEHNSHAGNDVMGAFEPEGDDLLIGRGMEVTSRHGHWNAIGIERGYTIEWRYNQGDQAYVDACEQVRRSGGIVSVNHPYMDCPECIWDLDHEYLHNDAMEVWNGYDTTDLNEPALALWQSLLVQGHRMTAIGGSDTHHPPSLIGKPTTLVKATSLSQASITDAIKRRRVYIVDGPGMEIDFTVRGAAGILAQVGGVVEAEQLEGGAEARLIVEGFEGGNTTACFVSEEGYVHNETVVEDAISLPVQAGSRFLRVELRNSTNSLVGMTNPIYFD